MKKRTLAASAAIAVVAGYLISQKKRAENNNVSFPLRSGVPETDPETPLGCDSQFDLDMTRRVRVLITGEGSYIGESFKAYAEKHYLDNFDIDTVDMIGDSWKNHSFRISEGAPYDCVFHVAGIAHADVGHVDEATKEKYYSVNTDLAIEVAKKAKESGVKQFIFMSSMIIYGGKEYVDRNTKPSPANFYGDSKWQADKGVRVLASDSFNVAVLRPPMIYGRGSKGNYQTLSKIAIKTPIFPGYRNKRSMLYIDNLCEFLCKLMISGEKGVFFPQNAEHSNTSNIVKLIATSNRKSIKISKALSPAVTITKHAPIEKIKGLAVKAFGNSYYDKRLSLYDGLDYQKTSLKESIRETELTEIQKKRVLILVNHEVVIYNFRLELVERLLSDGYEVHISTPFGEHIDELKKMGAIIHDIEFDRHGMNPIAEIGLLKHYKKLMKSVAPCIVFTYTVKCNVYGGMAARNLRIPFCANITGLGTTVNNGGIKEKLVLLLYKIGLKGVQRVFFQNEANKEFMVSSGVVKSPYTVLPGSGVNLDRHCCEEYPKTEDPLIISYIGRIMRDKGTDELLEAAKTIKKTHKDVRFRLIGFFDDDYKGIIKKAESDGIIEYIPQQQDIHPWMRDSHAIIMPSYHEGMSNVLLEAAATGRPVLASNIPGCRETFDEEVSGIGFEPQDSMDMARAIEMFIELPYERKAAMGAAGRKKMEREFNRTIVVDTYMKEIV